MTEMFEDEEGKRDGLFSTNNIIMMHVVAEYRFEKSVFVIVSA